MLALSVWILLYLAIGKLKHLMTHLQRHHQEICLNDLNRIMAIHYQPLRKNGENIINKYDVRLMFFHVLRMNKAAYPKNLFLHCLLQILIKK